MDVRVLDDQNEHLLELIRGLKDLSYAHVLVAMRCDMCVALTYNHTLIGFCCYDMSPKGISLHNLYIRDTFRKRGLAYALMYVCIKEARSHYSHDILVSVECPKNSLIMKNILDQVSKENKKEQYLIDIVKLLRKARKALKRYKII